MKSILSLILIFALAAAPLCACALAEETPSSPMSAQSPSPMPAQSPSPMPAQSPSATPQAQLTPVPAAAIPAPVPTVDNRLMRGASGPEVKQIQNRLRTLGFMTGAADGHFGPVTEQAVVALREYMRALAMIETQGDGLAESLPEFPSEKGDSDAAPEEESSLSSEEDALPDEDAAPVEVVDGEDLSDSEYNLVDGIVDGQIRFLLLEGGFSVYRETLARGAQGPEVTRLQNRLNTLNYLYGGVDGQFGKKTESAVTAFQKANNLPITGIADDEMQLRLFSEEAKPAPIPANPYVLKVSVADQRVYAYAYDVATGSYSKLVRTMVCSTGLKDTPTPIGTFTSKGPVARWGYFPKWDVYAQYLFRIQGGILFHSVLYRTSEESSLIQGSVSKLGQRASHGCVRLSVEDAKWIYNNCPAGTTVTVY